jgi:hypothetical protein
MDLPCTTRFDRRTGDPCLSCVYCNTKKIKCVSLTLVSPHKCVQGQSTTHRTRSKTPSKTPSAAPSASQLRTRTCSQSHGQSGTPAVPAVTTPKPPGHGHSKTITAVKPPAPAPAPAPASKFIQIIFDHLTSLFNCSKAGSASFGTQCPNAGSPCHGYGDSRWCSPDSYF